MARRGGARRGSGSGTCCGLRLAEVWLVALLVTTALVFLSHHRAIFSAPSHTPQLVEDFARKEQQRQQQVSQAAEAPAEGPEKQAGKKDKFQEKREEDEQEEVEEEEEGEEESNEEPEEVVQPKCTDDELETMTLKKDPAGLRATSCRNFPHHGRLFVAVTSPVGNFNLRKALRRGEWLMSTFPPAEKASYLFFVGKGLNDEEDRQIKEETKLFGDIVQLDLPDKYQHLAVKSVAACAWAVERLDVRYFLKVEDYMANNFKEIDAVVSDLDKRYDRTPYYGGGMIFGGGDVLPDGRWGCPKRHCPYPKYPSTYAGGMYLMDRGALKFVAEEGLPALDLRDPYPIEDHFIANLLHGHGIKVTEDRRLLWAGGKPYGAPSVIKKSYLLCMDTEKKPQLFQGEDGGWEGTAIALPLSTMIKKAWYGDPDPQYRWTDERGKDVTDLVKRNRKGSIVRVDGQAFGDPAPGTRKALILKLARPKRGSKAGKTGAAG